MERARHPRPPITPGWARWTLLVSALAAVINAISFVQASDAAFTVIASLTAVGSLALFAVDARRRRARRTPA